MFGTLCIIPSLFIILTILNTLVAQFIIGLLTFKKCRICLIRHFLLILFLEEIVIVRTIVGNVQSTIAVNLGQVTVTIESAYMACTDGDEVTVIDVVNGGCSITIYRRGIGVCIFFVGTFCRGISSGKHSIMDNDTVIIGIGFQILPFPISLVS